MRIHSLAGTSPRSTRLSVPRLMALCKARTRTCPSPRGGSVSERSSARPGATTQQARATAEEAASVDVMEGVTGRQWGSR